MTAQQSVGQAAPSLQPPPQAPQSPLQPEAGAGQGYGGSPHATAAAALWGNLPAEMRCLPQWAVAGADKAPMALTASGPLHRVSVNRPSEWMTFERACAVAIANANTVTTDVNSDGSVVAQTGLNVGFILTESDPFTCIDLDVKSAASHPEKPDKWTSQEDLDRHQSIIDVAASYTERSRSGVGFHVWVSGSIGKGRRKRGGVEVYSQERFMICTGDVQRALPIADRQAMLSSMISLMEIEGVPDTELRQDRNDDDMGVCIAAAAIEDQGELGRLMRGDWEGRNYPSHSEADFALVKMLGRITESNGACRDAFRMSMLSKRKDKPGKYTDSHLNRTLRKIRAVLAQEVTDLEVGQRISDALFWNAPGRVMSSRTSVTPVLAARPAANTGERKLMGRTLGGVQMRSIDWLWTGWIPKGYITLFAGETGAGKSTVLADITARVTTGAPWPGEYVEAPKQPGRVLWLGSASSNAMLHSCSRRPRRRSAASRSSVRRASSPGASTRRSCATPRRRRNALLNTTPDWGLLRS